MYYDKTILHLYFIYEHNNTKKIIYSKYIASTLARVFANLKTGIEVCTRLVGLTMCAVLAMEHENLLEHKLTRLVSRQFSGDSPYITLSL